MTDSGSKFFRSQYHVDDETGELTQKKLGHKPTRIADASSNEPQGTHKIIPVAKKNKYGV